VDSLVAAPVVAGGSPSDIDAEAGMLGVIDRGAGPAHLSLFTYNAFGELNASGAPINTEWRMPTAWRSCRRPVKIRTSGDPRARCAAHVADRRSRASRTAFRPFDCHERLPPRVRHDQPVMVRGSGALHRYHRRVVAAAAIRVRTS
jgi:hypothetical protein